MQLTLGKRADYAVRSILHLARHHGDGRRKAAEIAEDMAIPVSYVPQILATLSSTGLVSSVAGPSGGYALARDPAEVSLLEVIEAVEGPLQSKECVVRGGPCRWDEMCAVHVPWARAQQALVDELATATFADIAAIDAAMDAGTFEPPQHLGGTVTRPS